jgi:hypothetical protein
VKKFAPVKKRGGIKGEIQASEAAKLRDAAMQCSMVFCETRVSEFPTEQTHISRYTVEKRHHACHYDALRENIALIIYENLADRHGYLR